MVPVLLGLVALVVVVVVVQRARRTIDPLARRFAMASDRSANLRRLANDDAIQMLQGFDDYLDSARGVDAVIGGNDGHGGSVIVAAIGVRNTTVSGRPWYVGVVADDALALPRASLEPRSVRTVRVVAGRDEVVLQDSRIARGWRITAEDGDATAALLDEDPLRSRFADVLHRPIPWIIGLQFRPGAVAVHLSNPSEAPGDPDDVLRLARLATDVAASLRA